MEINKVLIFRNKKTGRETKLLMGFFKNRIDEFGPIPGYQFFSSEIPITGTFTGYPKNIMRKWMVDIGYELISEQHVPNVKKHKNEFKRGNICFYY